MWTQSIAKKFVEIWGSGLPKREIMHVDDLADAISFIIYKKLAKNKLLLNLIKKNSVINVGSGQELTIKKFANLINLLSQSRKKLRFNKSIQMVQKKNIRFDKFKKIRLETKNINREWID